MKSRMKAGDLIKNDTDCVFILSSHRFKKGKVKGKLSSLRRIWMFSHLDAWKTLASIELQEILFLLS